jgi:hypothetical protein
VGNVSLELDWARNLYVSPVDGRAYGGDGGEWTTYQPDQPPTLDDHRVLDRIALLTGEPDLAERVTV